MVPKHRDLSATRLASKRPAKAVHVRKDRISSEFQRRNGAFGSFGMSAAAGVLHHNRNDTKVGCVTGRGLDATPSPSDSRRFPSTPWAVTYVA
jgi:hypothetical protein